MIKEKQYVAARPLNTISLYSGIGGIELGLSAVIQTRTVCYVEREFSCIKVLIQRAKEGWIDSAPVYSDVATFPTEEFKDIDLITAGFPCQPWSWANTSQARGENDERNGWPDTIRIIREIRPVFIFMENVPNLLNHGYFGTILGDLAQAGYDAEWNCFSGNDINAPQIRERLFILAYADTARLEGWSGSKLRLPSKCLSRKRSTCMDGPPLFPPPPDNLEGWSHVWEEMPNLAPSVCKLAPGISDRVGELQSYGNAVIPAVAALAFRTLVEKLQINR
jgi:DNA (cytosine-5)-methyltransferase 1